MAELSKNTSGVAVFMDDILIYGPSKEEHTKTLSKVLSLINQPALKLNKKKCFFCLPQIECLGQTINKDGISPSPDKVKAIQELNAPANVPELRRILGMVNYFGRYLQDLSTVTKPQNELLKSNTCWLRGPNQEIAFKQ
ncbi:unnamed protein product [Natator depressus]